MTPAIKYKIILLFNIGFIIINSTAPIPYTGHRGKYFIVFLFKNLPVTNKLNKHSTTQPINEKIKKHKK